MLRPNLIYSALYTGIIVRDQYRPYFTVSPTLNANEIAAFRFKFNIYVPYSAIRLWYELR